MVQIISPSPRAMQAGDIGKALGLGAAKQAGLMEAEKAFSQSQGDPLKLASAMARMGMVDPSLEKAIGPMYSAMLSQMKGKAMGGLGDGQQAPPFPYQVKPDLSESVDNREVITKPEDLRKQIEGFIPPTQDQMINEAGQMYTQNPALFENNPNNAINFVKEKYSQQEKITQAHQARDQQLNTIQDSVVERLRKQVADLGAKIPATTMSNIEQDAIDSVKKGMTEQEAMRKYGAVADEASRQYQEVEDIGNWGLITNPTESKASLKALQKDFKKRGDQRNFADTIVADLKVSYPTAYAIADPVSDHPKIKQFIKELPYSSDALPGLVKENTERIVPKLAKLIAEGNASPQSVFFEMKKKNYDPVILKDYLDRKRDELKLSSYQSDQLGKEISPTIPFMNDLWLRTIGGIE